MSGLIHVVAIYGAYFQDVRSKSLVKDSLKDYRIINLFFGVFINFVYDATQRNKKSSSLCLHKRYNEK